MLVAAAALPDDAENTLSVEIGGSNYDYQVGEHSYQQQRSARATAARWLTGTHGGMGFEVGERYPVSHVVYKWLAQDLKRIGLVGGLAWSRQESAVVPFDMPALAHPSRVATPEARTPRSCTRVRPDLRDLGDD